ncbi:hypothetical protein [Halobellus marinus]|uniref:hypothetical protein n=1 Tax=Halobellus sp. GCM10025813 TaxID=3252665 RepID=UPI00361FF924
MSADHDTGAESWRCPPGSGEVSDDGERYRIRWHPSSDETKIAMFRVATDDRRCVLQHIRTLYSSLRHGSSCELDDDVGLNDVPGPFLAAMRDDGFHPVVGVEAYA